MKILKMVVGIQNHEMEEFWNPEPPSEAGEILLRI